MSSRLATVRALRRYHSSADWYTNPAILQRVREVLGADYLDPCPARYGAALADNGLAIPWRGRVYCNPPYGKPIATWIVKALTEPVDELILLVPAYTDTNWFRPLFACPAMCFVHHRIKFYKPDGSSGDAPYPSVLVYCGERIDAFATSFADLGPILRTAVPMRAAQPQLQEAS